MIDQFGICFLCNENKQLMDGHFFPKALYKYFIDRSEEDCNINPVFLTSTTFVQTSHQAKANIFCRECEQKFNKFGETPTLASYCRDSSNFPLREELTTTKALLETVDLKCFDSSALKCISPTELVYFASSILWKSAVYNWSIGGRRVGEKILLGPYEHELRKFLLGYDTELKNIYYTIEISSSNQPLIGFHIPMELKHKPFHMFSFSITGIYFIISLGKKVPKHHVEFCIYHSEQHPIKLGENREKSLKSDLLQFHIFK